MSELKGIPPVDDPAGLSDGELRSLLQSLEREEQSVSRRRTTLHARIDFVRAGGYASADPQRELLAALQATEVELSNHRLMLHAQIDALRTERSHRRL